MRSMAVLNPVWSVSVPVTLLHRWKQRCSIEPVATMRYRPRFLQAVPATARLNPTK